MIKVSETNVIYKNPLPILKSIQSIFPNVCVLSKDKILAAHVLAEAFEAVNATTHTSLSEDGGRTFNLQPPVFTDKNLLPQIISDSFKVAKLNDGRVIALGYASPRNPDLPLGNTQTGGMTDSEIFVCFSEDEGKSWSKPKKIQSCFGPHIEASAPVTILKNGDLVTPITNFPDWEGNLTEKVCGRLLRSEDNGETWQDNTVCMTFDEEISCYEQRLCQLEDSGAIVVVGWNEHLKTGERFNNHFTISYDNGKTFSQPTATGIQGQATGICAIGKDLLFATHAIRRDTDKPGIYGYIVDLKNGTWDIKEECVLWAPPAPIKKLDGVSEIFSFIRFGQPLTARLDDNTLIMSFWTEENGVYTTYAQRIEL